jgi:uncharacterized membrane protein YjdF
MKRAVFFLIIILIINLFGLYYRWYLDYPWFDQVLHFSGGFLVAMFFSSYLKEQLFVGSKLKNTLIIVGVAIFIGVIWEFLEYLASLTLIGPIYTTFHIKAYFIGDLDDTINDLLMDILGAITFALIFLHSFRSSKSQL